MVSKSMVVKADRRTSHETGRSHRKRGRKI